MRTIEQMVSSEIHYCVSSLVATLASSTCPSNEFDLTELITQAQNLAAPIDDWEEAAVEALFVRYAEGQDATPPSTDSEWWYRAEAPDGDWWATAEMACHDNDIEPYQREVYEHWIVSGWLADHLEAKGEKVDRDFAGMTVWARTTPGQSITMDSVIEAIYADLAAA